MMSKEKLAELQQQGQACLGKAKQIAAVAEAAGRRMSDSEQSAYDAEVKAAQDWLAQIRTAKDDQAVIDKAAGIRARRPCCTTPAGKRNMFRWVAFGMGIGALTRRPAPGCLPC